MTRQAVTIGTKNRPSSASWFEDRKVVTNRYVLEEKRSTASVKEYPILTACREGKIWLQYFARMEIMQVLQM